MLYINIPPLITLLTSTSLAAIALLLNTSIHNNQYSNKNIKTISGTIKDTKTYTYQVNKIIRSKDKVKKRIRKKKKICALGKQNTCLLHFFHFFCYNYKGLLLVKKGEIKLSKIKMFSLGGLDENGKNMFVIEIDKNIFVFLRQD